MRAAKGQGSVKKIGAKWRMVVRRDGEELPGPTVDRKSDAKKAWEAKYGKTKTVSVAKTLSDCFQVVQRSSWWTGLSPTTQETHKGAFAMFLALCGHLRPQNVTATILEAYRDEIKRGWKPEKDGDVNPIIPRKPRTVNRHMAGVQIVLSKIGIVLPKLKPEKVQGKRAMWLSPIEVVRFVTLTQTFPEYLRVACLLALRAGLRRGEICALCHEDYDDGGMFIRRNAVRGSGTIVIKLPKSHRGEGWVPLHPDLIGLVGVGAGFVIKTEQGKVIRPDNLSRALRLNTAKTEFAGIGFHDLRRTFAMSLIESGTDIITAAEITRHDPRVLTEDYTRSRRDLKRAAMVNLVGIGDKDKGQIPGM